VNPWLILAAIGLVVALTGGAYYQGRQDGEAKIVAQESREREIAAEAVDAALNTSAQAIAAIKVQHRTITQEVERHVIESPVYRDPGCRHDADGLRNINAALTGAPRPEPAGSGVVPRVGAAE
jgi:hypothetical protein